MKHIIAGLIFLTSFAIFYLSPVHPLTDSHYSMLLSENLIRTGKFELDDHFILPLDPSQYPGILDPLQYPGINESAYPYHVERINGHVYYHLSIGSSILSLPFVAFMNSFGIKTINSDGTYNLEGEKQIETILAALLMAMMASIFYYTAGLILTVKWSALVALTTALGTQIWSTASRVLWNHTWQIFLLSIVILMLVAHELGRLKIKPILLASLLSWMFFMRPTASLSIFTISVYVLIFYRKCAVAYCVTGIIWLAVFIAYSICHFGQLLPTYYLYGYKSPVPDLFWRCLARILFSPSRGLFVYVPVLIFVFFLFVRYWKNLLCMPLAIMGLTVILAHWITIAGVHSWEGHCYGARYMTDLVPWFFLIGILGVKALLDKKEEAKLKKDSFSWRVQITVGAFLALLSIFINGRGANSQSTWSWLTSPVNLDCQPARVWDWRNPQFLAGLIPPVLPQDYPLYKPGFRINCGTAASDKYLWSGWSNPEQVFRWTEGKKAQIIFSLKDYEVSKLRMKLHPFLVSQKHERQRVGIKLNAHEIAVLELKQPGEMTYSINIPANILRKKNVLILDLPDSVSPARLRVSQDSRRLGIAMQWFLFE